jgi:predicted transcriptional regulator
MYLRDRADRDGACYPAIGTIARELKLSRSTVKRAVADLEEAGYLSKEQRWRENGGKSSCLYRLQ